jgi:hypothetical protein
MYNLNKFNKYPVLQNRVFDSYEDAVNFTTGDIELGFVNGVVTNMKFNHNLLIYDENYDNEQGDSVVFKEHMKEIASIVEKYLGKKQLVEIGCGKGVFLEIL